MAKLFDVAAVGMINFDVNARGFDPANLRNKVTGAEEISLSLGGDAQNCAFTLARLGIRTAICGAVSRDMAGDSCLRCLSDAGVDTRFVARKDGRTGAAIQLLGTSEASVLYNAGVNESFRFEDVPEALYQQARILSLNSFFGCGKIGADVLGYAKVSGMTTVADTTTLMEGDSLKKIEAALGFVDYFLPSYAEASLMTGLTDPGQIAERLMRAGAGNVVVKLGAEGCYVRWEAGGRMVPGYPVDHCVDTTGCGDNFVAGFIASLARGLPLLECARFANAAGAINAASLGSNGAVRSYDQVTKYMADKQKA